MERGFIQIIIILLLFVVVLSLLGVSLRSMTGNPLVRTNFGYVWETGQWLWDSYLSYPARFLWKVFVDLIWEAFIENMQRLKKGGNPIEPPPGYGV